MEAKWLFTLIGVTVGWIMFVVLRKEISIKRLFNYSKYTPRIRTCKKCGAVHHKFTLYDEQHKVIKTYWERMWREDKEETDPERTCVCNEHAEI